MTEKWKNVQRAIKRWNLNETNYPNNTFYFHFFACVINKYLRYELTKLTPELKVTKNIESDNEDIKIGSNTIGRPLLQAFVGAMQDVQKGVFITTSTFTKGARNYAEKQQQKSLKLIDGDLLAELMIKYGIGLEKIQTYTVYKINEDFFE